MKIRRNLCLLSLLLLSVQMALAQDVTMSQYEYWLDNDYPSRKIVANTKADITFTVPLAQQQAGIHYLNVRMRSKSGEYGGLSRYIFYVPDNSVSNNGIKYEYWLDGLHQERTVVDESVMSAPLTIDVSSLSAGIHYFQIRSVNSRGMYGGLSRYIFYMLDRSSYTAKLDHIEYWIDGSSDGRQTKSIDEDGNVIITIDITDLPKGDHTFGIHGVSKTGQTCLLNAYSFRTENLPIVPTPKITRVGNTITISQGDNCDVTYPIEFFYTIDGSEPTRHSTKYEAPFEVVGNGIVKTIARQYAHDDSEVATLNIDWFKVANPKFKQVGNMLSISSDTTRAAIYYKIGSREEQLYEAPFRLTDQSVVTAVGRFEGYYDSEAITYQPRAVKSAKPVAAYNGRYLQLNSNEEGVSFHYTIDGSSPVEGLDVAGNAIEYRGQMTIDTLCTVRAVAIIDSMNVSDVLEFPIDYLYNDQTATAYLRKAGELEKAFEWCGGTNGVTQLHVEGTLSDKDVAVLKDMTALRHLDMQKVQLTSNQLVNDAFASSPMVSYISPSALTRAGGRLFADCPNLAAVVWNANVSLGSNTFAGVSNPNLLLYVNSAALNQTTATNVVVNGTAEKITLSDATTGNSNFYCPQAFTAQNISYTHEYQQQTVIGKTQGWETLTLPFTVQKMTHATHGALLPFSASGEGYPFWLMGLDGSGLQLAQSIEAYKPYVISMPNNPSVYDDQYNQNGKVTFSAQQAKVEVTQPETATDSRGNTLIPAYQTVARSAAVFALNVGEQRDEYAPGSAFIADYRDVRPFEVYMPQAADSRRAMALQELMGTVPTGIFELKSADKPDSEVSVYSLSGLLISKGRREEVMRQLAKGIYIINGKKTIVK